MRRPIAVHDGGRFDGDHESGPSICIVYENHTCRPMLELAGFGTPAEREAFCNDVVLAYNAHDALLAAVKKLVRGVGSIVWRDGDDPLGVSAFAEGLRPLIKSLEPTPPGDRNAQG